MKIIIASLLLLAATPGVRADNRGGEVVVVYNSRMADSKAVADHYAAKRQVPANQVFGFELSTNEVISRMEFRHSLEEPLAKIIAERKLWRIGSRVVRATATQPGHVEWQPVESKIRYAVLCYGVPLKIESDPNLKEEGTENLRPEMRRNEAAVDSELALLPVHEEKLLLAGPLRNPVYTATNTALFNPTNRVLMVARLDGPSAAIARGLVDKALVAEADGLWGRAYFDLRDATEPVFKMGDDWFRTASQMCRRLGFETVVDENPGTFPAGFPMSQIALYMGWYAQDVCGALAQPTVEFMPGAFAYHLHSYSADTVRSTSRAWVGPLLAKGATATMGCVYEPYLTGTPEVAVFTARWIFYGLTFGEAAYASQPVLSWQTTVVGDPLYRPFGGNPEQLHDALVKRHSKLVEWSYLRLLNVNLAIGKPLADCVAFLEQLEATKDSPVLSEKLGDLYLAQGKPFSAVHAYDEALKLEPTPMQRLRIYLVLGEKLTALERWQDAYDIYHRLLHDYADYPDKLEVYRKLLPVASKLNKKEEVAQYEAALKPPEVLTKPAAQQAKPEGR